MEKGAPVLKMTAKTAWAVPRTRKPSTTIRSMTRYEIDQFWRRKRMEEEEHLRAAEKAAARIRAKVLKEEDFRRFEDLLKEIMERDETVDGEEKAGGCDGDKEHRIGIKDWWTKSKYAYLNQPAIKSMEENATTKCATSTYIVQNICFCY